MSCRCSLGGRLIPRPDICTCPMCIGVRKRSRQPVRNENLSTEKSGCCMSRCLGYSSRSFRSDLTRYLHLPDVHRRAEEIAPACPERKFVDRKERLLHVQMFGIQQPLFSVRSDPISAPARCASACGRDRASLSGTKICRPKRAAAACPDVWDTAAALFGQI